MGNVILLGIVRLTFTLPEMVFVVGNIKANPDGQLVFELPVMLCEGAVFSAEKITVNMLTKATVAINLPLFELIFYNAYAFILHAAS